MPPTDSLCDEIANLDIDCQHLAASLNSASDAEFSIHAKDDCILVVVEDRIPFEAGDDVRAAVRAAFESWVEALPVGGAA